jgi:probable phosphoglycerate mutase
VIDIVLIRHGETAWNAERRLQGHLDVDLNETGLRQAELLAQVLQGERFDALVCSDLSRARKTAAPLAALQGLTPVVDPAWRERCYGALEGHSYDQIGALFPEAYAAMRARAKDYRYPQGENTAETLLEFSARSVAALTRALQSGARRIAVVTHGGVLDCINHHARGIDISLPRDFDIPNTGINRLSWDGKALKILQWADVDHLAGLALDEIDR